ncbi:hypothetical protein NMG60_11012683 [Bertholletia excelsa]
MAVRFLVREVSDLCLGKPALRPIPITATVADALAALKRSSESYVSVWSCDHSTAKSDCRCVGKICMVDVICFLCREKNLANPRSALQAPLSDVLPDAPSIVLHLEPQSSLLEAIDCILEGAQNLVVPIESTISLTARKQQSKSASIRATLHNGRQFCWLSQEDVIRFLLNSIGVFSPIPTFTIGSLNIIDTKVTTIYYDASAVSTLDSISRCLIEQKSIGVVDENHKLIGEISPSALASCDETVAAAITTLSAGDLMTYIDYGDPPENLVQLVKARLEERKLGAMLELLEELSSTSLFSSSSCSSDEDSGSNRNNGSGRYSSGRYGRSTEAIVCHPGSSLAAVMIQALAHRVSYLWVVDDDFCVVGMVTFAGILKVFRSIAGGPKRENVYQQ